MRVIWKESNRTTKLDFTDHKDFSEWIAEQSFYSGETLEIVEGEE